MKKVININFQGRVVMIEEVAYDQLKDYIESLRLHFAEEEGHEEIINDIESRISELFADVIKKGQPCVTEEDLNAIIHSIGRPQDFEQADLADAGISGSANRQHTGDETKENDSSRRAGSGTNASSAFSAAAARTKQLFRDENDKKIGGVCSGIANFFGIDPTLVRLIALLMLIFYGTGLLIYIILWICVPSSAEQVIGSSRRKLFRDVSNKTIGGVCAGLASYFDVSIWVPKVIFIIGALFSFPLSAFANLHFGGFFFPGINFFFVSLYIILWIVVPPAITASDRLSMKGESVDLNNIKSSVQEDLQDGKKKIMSQHGITEPVMVTPNRRSTLGDIIILICKIFAYFILGCVLVGILGGLIAAGIGIFGFSPLKDYIISGYWQNAYGWVAVILLIWMPVLAIIIWIIRRLMKAKSSPGLRIGFIVLLVVGLIAGGLFINSVYQDFRFVSQPVVTPVPMANANVNKLNIELERKPAFYNYQRRWFMAGESVRFLGDSARVNNTRLILRPSTTDSFSVSVVKLSNGRSIEDANSRAAAIRTAQVIQQGEKLIVPCAITIDKISKFRNQYVLVTVNVPIGKKIEVHANRRRDNQLFIRMWDDDWNDFDIDELDNLDGLDGFESRSSLNWEYDTEYIMTKEGLERTQPDLEARKERIESSQEIIEREQRKIREEEEIMRRNYEEQKSQNQRTYDQKQRELEQKAEKLKSVLPADSGSTTILDPAPMLWIGKSLLRLS